MKDVKIQIPSTENYQIPDPILFPLRALVQVLGTRLAGINNDDSQSEAALYKTDTTVKIWPNLYNMSV